MQRMSNPPTIPDCDVKIPPANWTAPASQYNLFVYIYNTFIAVFIAQNRRAVLAFDV